MSFVSTQNDYNKSQIQTSYRALEKENTVPDPVKTGGLGKKTLKNKHTRNYTSEQVMKFIHSRVPSMSFVSSKNDF